MPNLSDGYDGYLTPDPAVVTETVRKGLIVLDTNVLLDLYSFEPVARDTAFEVLDGVKARLWIPAQVADEFWRNRLARIAGARPKPSGIGKARQEVSELFNRMRPYGAGSDSLDSARKEISARLDEIDRILDEVRGTPLDVDALIQDTRDDSVLDRLMTVTSGRVGSAPTAEARAAQEAEGARRQQLAIPPGFADAGKGNGGLGDYLLWEQSLAKVESEPRWPAFAVVTNDSKSDWRMRHPDGAASLGVRPELVAEAFQRTGRRMILLRSSEFFRFAAAELKIDQSRSDQLATESAETRTPLTWLAAARLAMADAPDEWWSVEEIVDEIRNRGLRDISGVRTPSQTLRRDLNVYGAANGFVKWETLWSLQRDDDDLDGASRAE